LSEEQLDIINLPTTKDWVIQGAPGTGKTVMAIYRAGQASQASKNKKVLMLVYNKPLMSFLSTAIQGNYYKNVEIKTYHQWLSDMYSENWWGSVPKDGDEHDWSAIAHQMSECGKLYSHVIIDEAQDFPIELLQILKKISDHMTCFIDPNQAIEVGKTSTFNAIKTLCLESPYKLTRNFRNTKPIRDLSALYCKDGKPAPSDIPGKKPTIIKCAAGNFDDQNQKMASIIKRKALVRIRGDKLCKNL
jgi:DNA helicase IV